MRLSITESEDVYAWGWNESGQTGLPAPQGVYSSSCEASADDDSYGILLEPTLLELESACPEQHLGENQFLSISAVACGQRHSAAVTSRGLVITWGWGKYGQLDGEVVDCGDEGRTGKGRLPTAVLGLSEAAEGLRRVWCGPWCTLVGG